MTTKDEVLATGLFDAGWYLRKYPDVAAGKTDPAEHYAVFGQAEQRMPNAYFDEAFYLNKAGDLGALIPLLHYARYGEAADLAPGPEFNPTWYRHAYTLPRSISALADFLRNRLLRQRLPSPRFYAPRHSPPYAEMAPEQDCFEAILIDLAASKPVPSNADVIRASGLFDANHYLINGSDVHEASLDPIEHFCAHGWREGRQPNIYFDTNWYTHTNPELVKLDFNPLVHYILEGEKQGRRPVVYFDPIWYREEYDVPTSSPALAHFLENRRSQKYSPNKHFDLSWYLHQFHEQIGHNRDPFAHFLQTGTYKNISPARDFDPVAVRKTGTGKRTRHFLWRLHPDSDNPLVRIMRETYR